MYVELLKKLNGTTKTLWTEFLKKSGLEPDDSFDCTVLIRGDDNTLVASGSRFGNLIKCIAVDELYQGEGLTATIITALRKDAASSGIKHLLLYTKPKNKSVFESLFFYSIAQTDDVLLMEDRADGICSLLESIPHPVKDGKNGCIVVNCNPFTLGHLYLAEKAAKSCDTLYIFVVSEDKSEFSAHDRYEMVKAGTGHIPNVIVAPTGPYLISSATFPTYFLKGNKNPGQIKCLLDIEIFVKHYAKKLNITVRFLGTEPLSETTSQYNTALKTHLPQHGIEVCEIPRIERGDEPISASRVRKYLSMGKVQEAADLLPDTTYQYLINNNLL